MVARIEVNGTTFEVTMKGGKLLVDGKPYDITWVDDHTILCNGKHYDVDMFGSTTVLNQKPYTVVHIKEEALADGLLAVHSPIAGRVASCKVKKGDVVKKGDILCTIEAMKMENHIIAQMDGKITQCHIEKNGTVKAQERLFLLERG